MTLTDFFIPAPLSALYTIVSGVSVASIFDTAGIAIFRSRAAWMRCLYFMAGLLCVSWLLFVCAWAGLITPLLLKALQASFVFAGAFFLIRDKADLLHHIVRVFKPKTSNKIFDTVISYTVPLVALCLVLMAISTPTDADSLDYHLGIPLEILKTGSIWYNPQFLHYRLIGFGEMMNLLGVANGCPQLGSFLQVWALFMLMAAFTEGMAPAHKLSVAVLCLSLPLLLFFIPGQKHQFTGVVATSICVYAVLFQAAELRGRLLLLFASVLLFAVGIKYSFLPSVLCVWLLLYMYKKDGAIFVKQTLSLLFCAIVILLPLWSYKLIYFGDPLSPLLERFSDRPDAAVLTFQSYLLRFSDSKFSFPLRVLLPSSFGNVSVILGWAAVCILIGIWCVNRRLSVVIVLLLLVTISVGQQTARFFVEPYYWMIPLFIGTKPWQRVVIRGGKIQLFVLLPLFVAAAYILFPGVLSDKLRERSLSLHAIGYNECRWLNEVLPKDARICTTLRSRVFIEQPTFPKEYISLLANADSNQRKAGAQMLKEYATEYFVMDDVRLRRLVPLYPGDVVATHTFDMATRNPFNRKQYTLLVYKLK